VSELLDRGARELLGRVYAERAGTWVMTRLADPSADHQRWAASMGIGDLMDRDVPTTDSGRNDTAHTRWGRAFARALYHQHRWWSNGRGGWRATRRIAPNPRPLEIEWGGRVRRLGVIPAGRAVRVRQPRGGQAARRAVQARPRAARIYDGSGRTAGRWADPARRDWA
jgi:hypothetical protein